MLKKYFIKGTAVLEIIIRREEEKDYHFVEELNREAFWNLHVPGCDEHYLTNKMRNHPDFIRDMAFVAEVNEKIVGSIMYTKSSVENEIMMKLETLTFGPLCVLPEYQRKGIGTALINHTKNIAVQKGCPAIIILGDPHNYCKHGFKCCKDYKISWQDNKYPLGLLILELEKGIFNNHSWKFNESSVYTINKNEAEEYDKRFGFKEKKYQYSQELFSMMCRAYIE